MWRRSQRIRRMRLLFWMDVREGSEESMVEMLRGCSGRVRKRKFGE